MAQTEHMITTAKMLRSCMLAAQHPAFLFSAGNVALIVGHAEPIAILLNIGLTIFIFSARFIELVTEKILGVPFTILAMVNFFTSFSIEVNTALGKQGSRLLVEGMRSLDIHTIVTAFSFFDLSNLFNTEHATLAAHTAALALSVWAIGSLQASRHERKSSTAQRIKDNPQTYYGAGDMAAVNASGSANPYSFLFMLLGFVKSTFIGRSRKKSRNHFINWANNELTAAKIYGIGYIIGALTSLALPGFAIAQLCWAVGYFGFKKDTPDENS